MLGKQRQYSLPLEWHREIGLIINARSIQEETAILTPIAVAQEVQPVLRLMTGWISVLGLIVSFC